MVDGSGTSKPSGGGGGGGKSGNRNRNSRKRNKNRNKQQGPKRPTVPPPSQTKLIFRNIGNAELFGSVKQVLRDLVEKVVEASNAKTNNQYVIEIDNVAVRFLLDEDGAAKQYLAEEKKRLRAVEEEEPEDEAAEASTEGQDVVSEEEDDKTKGDGNEQKEIACSNSETLDVIVAPPNPANVPVITARPLYVNPPKKTRRRGERGGVVYVLLTAPKIEKIDDVSVPKAAASDSRTETEDGKPADKVSDEPSKTGDMEGTPALISEEEKEVTSTTIPEEQEVAPVAKTVSKVPKHIQTTSAVPAKPVDYSRSIAEGRLLLSRAIDSLVELSKEDASTQQRFAGCLIEPSMSGKTWRHQHHRSDRREGTIESTADYKNWAQSLTKQKEELKARPKPVPGGGAAGAGAASSTGTGTTAAASSTATSAGGNNGGTAGDGTTENGQPIAAIVQHLQAKRQELKRKKAKKKKEKSDKNKGGKTNASSTNNSNKTESKDGGGRGGGKKGKGNEKGRRGESKKKKKKGGGGDGGGGKAGNKAIQVAPTALLKPQKS